MSKNYIGDIETNIDVENLSRPNTRILFGTKDINRTKYCKQFEYRENIIRRR